MNNRHFILIMAVLLLLLAVPLVAGAQCGCPVIDPIDSVALDANCDRLSISWSHSVGTESILLIASMTQLYALEFFSAPSGSYTVNFNPPLTEATELFIAVGVIDGPDIVAEALYDIVNCEATANAAACADGRLTYMACDRLAVYPIVSETGVGLTIYTLSRGSNEGHFSLYLPETVFDSLPQSIPTNCTIAHSEDSTVVVYLLTTGQIQINVGPDDEGKVFVYIFDDLLSAPTRSDTYMAGQPPQILPSCV